MESVHGLLARTRVSWAKFARPFRGSSIRRELPTGSAPLAVVVGSGPVGAVYALRLAEKGYRVVVVEKGKSFAPSDYGRGPSQLSKMVTTQWPLVNALFNLHGPLSVTFFKHLISLRGQAVGGGSTVFAAMMYGLTDNQIETLESIYGVELRHKLELYGDLVKKMMGVQKNPRPSLIDKVSQEFAQRYGLDHELGDLAINFAPPDVKPGDPAPDRQFGGVIPGMEQRNTCTSCGQCMSGCPNGSKNDVTTNYLALYLRVLKGKLWEQTKVIDVMVREDGKCDIVVEHLEKMWGWKKTQIIEGVDMVMLAAGPFENIKILKKINPNFNGEVKTNSDTFAAVTSPMFNGDKFPGTMIGNITALGEQKTVAVENVNIANGPRTRKYGLPFFNPLALLQVDQRALNHGTLAGWANVVAGLPGRIQEASDPRWAENTRLFMGMAVQGCTYDVRVRKNGSLGTEILSGAPMARHPLVEHYVQRLATYTNGKPKATVASLLGMEITAHADHTNNGTPQTDVYGRVLNLAGAGNPQPDVHMTIVPGNASKNPTAGSQQLAEAQMGAMPNAGDCDLRPPLGSNATEFILLAPRNPAVPGDAPAAYPFTRPSSPHQWRGSSLFGSISIGRRPPERPARPGRAHELTEPTCGRGS